MKSTPNLNARARSKRGRIKLPTSRENGDKAIVAIAAQWVSGGLRALGMVLAGLALTACSGLSMLETPRPVPRSEVLKAQVPFAETANAPIRYWADLDRVGGNSTYIETEIRSQIKKIASAGDLDFLALSGGGFNGAFGVGYLAGWTKRGDRPNFRIVTGISVGALIAPFAFLGTAYDDKLLATFEQLSTKSMQSRSNPLAILFGAEAVENNEPLKLAIAQIITAGSLDLIAKEHEKGRRLLIGTTNLDAQRPVIWDIGAIAASEIPHKVELVRQILLASAALPGIYPPVLIKVEAKGQPYTELHVDGGVTQQVVLLPDHKYANDLGRRIHAHIYVIYDDQLDPAYAPPKQTFAGILLKAVPTLLKYQGLSDIARLRRFAETNRAGFSLAAIPPEFEVKIDFPPSADYLNNLYKLGYEMGQSGKWGK